MQTTGKLQTVNDFKASSISTLSTAQKNLVFTLNEEQYGIPLASVEEIIGLANITPIPNTPNFFKGLINLRGMIISAIDLRLKLNMKASKFEAKKTSIIINNVNNFTIGTIVDDVTQVVGFDDQQIEQNLNISNGVQRNFIKSVAKTADNTLVLLLNIEKVLTPKELELITH